MPLGFLAAGLLARHGRRGARWFGHEFLLLYVPKNHPATLIQACRLAGCISISWVMRMGLSGPLPPHAPGSIALFAGVFVLAMLVGNIVKEMTAAGCGVTSCNLPRSFANVPTGAASLPPFCRAA